MKPLFGRWARAERAAGRRLARGVIASFGVSSLSEWDVIGESRAFSRGYWSEVNDA